MKHNEYDIVIHAPTDKGQCHYGVGLPHRCKNDGSWAIRIVDDRNNVLAGYINLCEAHLIQVVLTWMVQN